ncbi:MAG: amidohydrolase family protein [Gracilibacteraceae bacterium]|jgi:imidazolonepropionase-like amidohydrolase|nr:amidohydrolase family protein [Gracilibacteraceae bacterium]
MNTLVKAGWLHTCTGAPPVRDGWFLFEGERFTAVGAPGEPCPPAGVTLDFSGRSVMPGLIDGHTHFSLSHADEIDPMPVMRQLQEPGPRKICKAVMYAGEHLRAGVTTVRGMGEDDFIDFDLKAAIDAGYIAGPRVIPAGAFISPTHGHGQTGQTVSDGVEGTRKNCRLNLAKGAELLKVFGSGGVVSGQAGLSRCTATPAELRAAVEEAAALGKYVAAHVHGGPGMDLCLAAGVRSLEHATLCTDEQIERIAAAGAWVTVTFSPLSHPAGLRNLDPRTQSRLDSVRRTYYAVVGKMLARGVNMCLGTDGVHGAMWFEAAEMEKCGAGKQQCLEFITRRAAEACRREKEIGSIAAGKYADFIVLRQNPLDDLAHLRSPLAVYMGGLKESERMNRA